MVFSVHIVIELLSQYENIFITPKEKPHTLLITPHLPRPPVLPLALGHCFLGL